MGRTLRTYKEDRNPNNILTNDPERIKFLGGPTVVLTEVGREGVD
jgi:hypothetical protein